MKNIMDIFIHPRKHELDVYYSKQRWFIHSRYTIYSLEGGR